MANGILVPQPGIELISSAVEGQSFNHWTTREDWRMFLFIKMIFKKIIAYHISYMASFP